MEEGHTGAQSYQNGPMSRERWRRMAGWMEKAKVEHRIIL